MNGSLWTCILHLHCPWDAIHPPAHCTTDPHDDVQVDLRLSGNALYKRFPDFPRMESCHHVTVKAGQMLYLPSGWFHEVSSCSGHSSAHIAVNYWFHPPDNLPAPGCGQAETEHCMRHPYSTDFWPELWNERCRRHGWGEQFCVCERGKDHYCWETGRHGANNKGEGGCGADVASGAEPTRKRQKPL
jgi:hypothetical protein